MLPIKAHLQDLPRREPYSQPTDLDNRSHCTTLLHDLRCNGILV